jgi:hypothetical protein
LISAALQVRVDAERQLIALPTRDGAALRIRFVLDKQINAVATRQRKLNYP